MLHAALSSAYPPNTPSAQPLKFDLDVSESPPTPEQFQLILKYLHPSLQGQGLKAFVSAHPSAPEGRLDGEKLAKVARENANSIKWPIVVNWDTSLATLGDAEGVKEILEQIREKRDGEKK